MPRSAARGEGGGARALVRAAYHVHTGASYDSRLSPEQVLEEAIAAGIDVLCVTDHDTVDGAVRLQAVRCPEVKVVIGCEFTADDGSHVIGLGLRDMIPERGLLAIMERIKLQGGVVVLPHPFRRSSGVFRNEARRPPAFVREVLALTDVVERFNGRDAWENNERSRRLALESGLPSVAGSDAHRPGELGSVFVEYFEEAFAHGASAHCAWFPSQPPRKENPAKRRLMELYHRHEDRLPPVITAAYRAMKRWTGRAAPRVRGAPRLQYELPPAGKVGGHGE